MAVRNKIMWTYGLGYERHLEAAGCTVCKSAHRRKRAAASLDCRTTLSSGPWVAESKERVEHTIIEESHVEVDRRVEGGIVLEQVSGDSSYSGSGRASGHGSARHGEEEGNIDGRLSIAVDEKAGEEDEREEGDEEAGGAHPGGLSCSR